MVKVISIPINAQPKIVEIPDDNILTGMQELVGGYITTASAADYNKYGLPDLQLMANEEGLLMGLPVNRAALSIANSWNRENGHGQHEVLVGNCFVSRCNDEGETIDVKDDDLKKFVMPHLSLS